MKAKLPISPIPFISLLALLALSSCDQSRASSSQTELASARRVSAPKLPPAAFQAKLKSVAKPQLIDVRTPEEVMRGKIAGAENMDFQRPDFAEMLGKLDKSQPVFVYCAVGGRSGRSAQTLQQLGFTHIYDLEGGITRWQQEGLPVEKP